MLKKIPIPTEKGKLTLLFNGFAPERSGEGYPKAIYLQAFLRNDTPFKFQSVSFAMYEYDANGNDLWLCGVRGISTDGGCIFTLFDSIEPGQTHSVESPGNFAMINTARTSARTEFKIHRASYFIKYDIQAEPVVNENFAISPRFSLKGIGLDFRNKASDVIEVAWDQSVYIDEDGTSSRLIKGNVNLTEKDRPQPNTVIPPGAKLQETVFPIDRVQQQDGKWAQLPILPDLAYIYDKAFLSDLKAKDSWVQDTLMLRQVCLFVLCIGGNEKHRESVVAEDVVHSCPAALS